MGSRSAVVAVTNDLTTDRRVARTCDVLRECNYKIVLVGRRKDSDAAIPEADKVVRMRMWFGRGPLFYAEYNIRLFLLLMTNSCDLVVSNDLDTLLACWLAHRMKGCDLVYDSHEYFTEVPELKGRFARRVWLSIERFIFPKLKHVITVNGSIAAAYNDAYGVEPVVVRNLGSRPKLDDVPTRAELGLPIDKVILILQGSGINVDRGAEELVLAMKRLPNTYLLLIGGGDAWDSLRKSISHFDLSNRIRMIERLPYEEMMGYTINADIGLSLDKDSGLNYRFSLPNKLFDYHYAGLAIVASDLPEVSGIVRGFDSGVLIDEVTPETIQGAVEFLLSNPEELARLKQNAKFAAAELDPQIERGRLKDVILGLGR